MSAAATSAASGPRPTISVVMIAYDTERFVGQAIDSVLMQRVDADYEIVIGEDRSTDRTREIVLDYARRYPERIRPILRERNLGMNRNFAETLREARGRYVALLDSDDYWTSPLKLRKQLDYLEQHPECSMCFHNTLVVYDGDERATHPFHVASPRHLHSRIVPKPISTLEDLLAGNFIQTGSVMFRAGLYGSLPAWFLEMPTFDWPLHVLNAEHGDIGYIDEILGAYRVHGAGMWSTHMARFETIEHVEAMIRAHRLLDRHTAGRYRRASEGSLVYLHRRAAKVLLAHGRRGRAMSHALRALWPPRREHRAEQRRALAIVAQSLSPRRGPVPGRERG